MDVGGRAVQSATQGVLSISLLYVKARNELIQLVFSSGEKGEATDTPSRSQNLDTVMPDAVNCCSRRCHAKDFRGSVGRAMSRSLENGLKSVNPRGYQGGQEWLWWALTD